MLEHNVGELLEPMVDKLPPIAIDKVVVAGHDHHIKRLGLPFLVIVQPKSMDEILNTSSRDCDVITVLNVSTVLGSSVACVFRALWGIQAIYLPLGAPKISSNNVVDMG